MHSDFQAQVAFHLTGTRRSDGLEAVEGLDQRPALLAPYRDLTSLRYDFPVVLLRKPAEGAFARSLSGIIDDLLKEIAKVQDADRIGKHLLRLEQEIRTLAARGESGALSALWDKAAAALVKGPNDLIKDSLGRARALLQADGEVLDCGKALPERLIAHAWRGLQQRKAEAFRAEVDRLSLKLSDILKADFVRSPAGLSAENLRASVGEDQGKDIDFEMMSRLLTKVAPKVALPESRRRRLQWLLSALESQRFLPRPGAGGGEPLGFSFDNCEAALDAYRERLPKAIELAKAIAIARLETQGEYDELKHDPLFAEFGARGLDAEELAAFPDYFVCLNAANLQEPENARLMEILSAGLPVKVLVQTDDLREDSPVGNGHFSIGLRSAQLTGMAMGQNDIYVLQSSASNLVQYSGRVGSALNYSGAALFSVFSGAAAKTDLPPYLIAAAAMESRAFPAFAYDPSAGADWASRFSIADNPQAEADWPVASLAYEDEDHQRASEEIAFTLVDFLACDRRFDAHFARVPRAKWNGSLVSVSECLASQSKGMPDRIPSVLVVDADNVLQRNIVDGQLIREARRCRDNWHSLQELGGIHNSHAQALLAREKKAWEEIAQREAESRAKAAKPVAEAQTSAPASATQAAEAAPAPAEPERDPDMAYIETARCSTCNECTLLNNKMFAYNDNQQAYIKDPDAGTFRQMVEAAESCQVSVIHPGKPRNPNEPGLEELIKRAEPFQ
ncbi:MAG: hypothetical protein HYY28_08725 [Betaproteobacteria bacterium]|nr:hypothetical protein [Betaproteobacteria bacterium]